MDRKQPPVSEEEVRQIFKQAKSHRWAYGGHKDKARPEALALMKEDWYWSNTEENSPFGNEYGSNALQRYRLLQSETPDSAS